MGRPAVKRAKVEAHNREWRDAQSSPTVDELESFLQINSHLLSNLSHEFRSALTAIRGYTKRVMEERSGPLTEAQREDLAIVQKNTRRLLDLASYSLPFITEQRLHLEPFDLRELWQQTARRLRFRLERAITLREQLPAEPLIVTGDRARLGTICEIILTNAIRCSPDQGDITAELSEIECGGESEVTVKVRVPGTLLPSQLLATLFEHQDEPSRVADPGRLRLAGLSLARDLVLLHGGRLEATSIADEGTAFTMSLPVLAPKSAEMVP